MNGQKLNEVVGDVLLNIKDVGEVIQKTPGAIRVDLCRGVFPVEPFKLGSRLRWRASDIREWMKQAGSVPGVSGEDEGVAQ